MTPGFGWACETWLTIIPLFFSFLKSLTTRVKEWNSNSLTILSFHCSFPYCLLLVAAGN